MEKLADISIFNSLCRTTRIHNGWQTTPERRESWLRMSRGGIIHALQMLSSSTIGYTPQQVAQFIKDVIQEFYRNNPNGHIEAGEPRQVQRTGLIRREQHTFYTPSRDGESATADELMDASDRKLGIIARFVNAGIYSRDQARDLQQMFRVTRDYMAQLYEHNQKKPIPNFAKWYKPTYDKYCDLVKKFAAALNTQPPR